MNIILKSPKKLNSADSHIKTPEPHKKQGWPQRFLNWLNQGTQKAVNQQGSCFG